MEMRQEKCRKWISQIYQTKNTSSQSCDIEQDHWFRIGYQRMHRLRTHTSARSSSHPQQVLPFRIRQDSANDKFISTLIMLCLTIQGNRSNVLLIGSSKECFIHHIHQILHQATFIFSILWRNACKLARVGHSKSYKSIYPRF
jgi:hypothetical protein